MSSKSANYYMSVEQLNNLAGSDIQGLVPILDWDENEYNFAILDCFEQSLRKSQRLLFVIDEQMALLTTEGMVLSQHARPDTRFITEFQEGPVKEALTDLSPLRALLTVASGTMRNGKLTLIDNEGKTHARAGLRELMPISGKAVVLIAPQGLRGYDQALDDLTAHIRTNGGTPLTAGNLYQMIDHACVDYVAKPTVDIHQEETAFDTATNLIDSYLPIVRVNEYGIIHDLDTEFLHDYRIALRKIRSVLSLFKGVYDIDQTHQLKMRFSALMTPTGPLRDLDVYLLEQESFYSLVPHTMHSGLDAMFSLMRSRRMNEQARLATHLKTGRYKKEIKALTKLFSKKRKLKPGPNSSCTSYDFACELIWKRYRKICRLAATINVATPDQEIHELRIECKKLRYLMEFFGPIFPQEPFDSLLKSLKRLQDSLGLFNDCVVQQINLQTFVNGLSDEPHQLEITQSIGSLITILYQRQSAEREKITNAFVRFSSDRMQRSFRTLFQSRKEF
ncbi:MAG: CHAD domain-containing protein [Nitrosomonas sp.]|nr:CHAD domain-containing protein [Nitrosomonas sp.]